MMKVLYIEDNEMTLKNARRLITGLSYEFLAADTAASGLTQLQSQPDVILVDMELPDSNGIPLIEQIRQRMPSVPIITISGYAAAGEREACIAAGSNAYLAKPYDMGELVALLKGYASASIG